MTKHNKLSLGSLIFTVLLTACSAPEPIKQSVSPQQQRINATNARVQALLAQAETAPVIRAAQIKANAANLLISIGQRDEALALLEGVDIEFLPPSIRYEIAAARAKTALNNFDPDLALEYLDVEKNSAQTSNTSIQFAALREQALAQQSNPVSHAYNLINHGSRAPESQRQSINNRIWGVLQKISTEQLQTLVNEPGNTYFQQGWVELALLYRQNFRADALSSSINDWNTIWQSHPARLTPPDTASSQDAGTITAGKIGVLLPATGKLAAAGQAIREGLTSAYYLQLQKGESVPLLTFIDSERVNTAADVNALIEAHQFDFIIGPLEKRLVSTLNSATNLNIPVLALNYDQNANINQIYQFGLAPEDEARQAAELAWQEGHTAALVLTPQTGWGNRVVNAFTDTFEQLGGTVTGAVSYGDQQALSEDIGALLETDKSEERAELVGRLTNLRMEFEERRRDDASIIFLSATPQTARQILPTLAFHFAGDLPVIASSHIYSGIENPQSDRDLNGVRFVSTPWLLKDDSEIKQALSVKRQTNSRYASLYALGADAFTLYPHLNVLNAQLGQSIQGQTGKLSIDGDKRVRRTLEWAQFSQGNPQLLNTTAPTQTEALTE